MSDFDRFMERVVKKYPHLRKPSDDPEQDARMRRLLPRRRPVRGISKDNIPEVHNG